MIEELEPIEKEVVKKPKKSKKKKGDKIADPVDTVNKQAKVT